MDYDQKEKKKLKIKKLKKEQTTKAKC